MALLTVRQGQTHCRATAVLRATVPTRTHSSTPSRCLLMGVIVSAATSLRDIANHIETERSSDMGRLTAAAVHGANSTEIRAGRFRGQHPPCSLVPACRRVSKCVGTNVTVVIHRN